MTETQLTGQRDRAKPSRDKLKWLILAFSAMPLVIGALYMWLKPPPDKVPRHIPPPVEASAADDAEDSGKADQKVVSP